MNDETRHNIPYEISELSVPRTHFDRQPHIHHMVTEHSNSDHHMVSGVSNEAYHMVTRPSGETYHMVTGAKEQTHNAHDMVARGPEETRHGYHMVTGAKEQTHNAHDMWREVQKKFAMVITW